MDRVEVVYVPSEGRAIWHTTHVFKPGMTVLDVLTASGVFLVHPTARELSVGVFSKQVSKDQLLRAGDRVELYRPLLGDPKEKRRKRAQK